MISASFFSLGTAHTEEEVVKVRTLTLLYGQETRTRTSPFLVQSSLLLMVSKRVRGECSSSPPLGTIHVHALPKSIFPYVSLYLCPCVSLYLCPCVGLYLCPYVSLYLCPYVSLYLYPCVSLYLCLHACACLYVIVIHNVPNTTITL